MSKKWIVKANWNLYSENVLKTLNRKLFKSEEKPEYSIKENKVQNYIDLQIKTISRRNWKEKIEIN